MKAWLEPTPLREGRGIMEEQKKSKRGFAAMDRALVSAIARKGGIAAHAAGTAHEFTAEEGRIAGRKGGKAMHAKRRGTKVETTEKTPENSQENTAPAVGE
jgi:general stress protein YciG